MNLFSVTTAALLGLFAAPAVQAKPMARCPLVRAPVCALLPDGSRAKFVNACAAEWKKGKVLHDGDCLAPGKEPMMCSMIYKPVCAVDPATKADRTYPNLCSAETANAKVVRDGKCGPATPGQ
ncbi:MAG: hypothetical protein JO056_04095 [Alphaproteobacteria bacterium]|nr:hypothetical protein [Alphaproteobacteria bacterium]